MRISPWIPVVLGTITSLATVAMGCGGDGNAPPPIDDSHSLVLTSSGGGVLSSDPPGIDCRSDCLLSSVIFPKGTTVSVAAQPDPGRYLVGWSGDCTGTGACQVVLDEERHVTATFGSLSYRLDVHVDGAGTGSVTSNVGGIDCPDHSCTGAYGFSNVVVLTATPSALSDFVGWTGACEGTTATCQLVMDRARAATATFRKKHFDVTVAKDGTGTGNLRSDPPGIDCGDLCTASFEAGQSVRLIATPSPTATFGGWGGDCMGTMGMECVVSIEAARSASATFTTITYPVNVLRTVGGKITSTPEGIDCGDSCTATFDTGTVVTLNATPSATGRFAGWTGACTGTTACALLMTAAKTVAARFVFPLTAQRRGTGGGTISSVPLGISCGSACASDFDPNTDVTLTATADANSTFLGWSGDCTGPTDSCTVRMAQAKNVVASFAKKTYALVVNRAGNGNGTVGSSPAGIDCGADCAFSFDSGTLVTLTANPSPASTFTGWAGACTGTDPCALLVDRVRFVTATFSRITYPLTVNRSGQGTITSDPVGVYCGSSCTASYDAGTVVRLTATPEAGTSFGGWAGACAGTGTCTVTLDSPKTVLATFARVLYGLQVSTGAGGGTVTSAPQGIYCGATCRATFDSGAVVTLTATPDVTGTFTGWSGACTGTAACQVVMDADKTATAHFTFPLNVARTGPGQGRITADSGTIDCGTLCRSSYDNATVVRLSTTVSAGSFFTGWSGDCTGTGDCTVTMTAARNVSANFTTGSFTLVVNKTGAGGGRIVSIPTGLDCGSNCSATFGAGATITLSATPDDTSTFAGWSAGCTGTGPQCSITVDAAKTATATFNKKVFSLNLTRTGPGLVTADTGGIFCGAACSGTYPAGSTVVLTATPNDGASFTGWSGACNGTQAACNVILDGNKTVSATFAVNTYPITVGRQGQGTGTVVSTPTGIECGATCSATYTHGTVLTLNATPATGSVFGGWTGACTGTGACTVTLVGARTVTAQFDRATYALVVNKVGTGTGRVAANTGGLDCGATCSMSYAAGSIVALTATADGTSTFAGWSGACTGRDACTITIDSAKAITATFTRLQYTLTVAGTEGGILASTPIGIYCGASCSGTFDAGSTLTLTADPNLDATFVGWGGACSGTDVCTLTMDGNKSVTGRFTFPVTVSKQGLGDGRILSSSPLGIDCGAACELDVTGGTQIIMTATAASGSRFVGWSGPCTGTGSCSVVVDARKDVVASFAPDVLSLSVTRTGSGAGRVTSSPSGIDCGSGGSTAPADFCATTFPTGLSVTLTATPDASSQFAGWSGACAGSATSCTLAMTDTRSVTATFTRTTSTLTVARSGQGTGIVTTTPAGVYCGATCSATFDTGTQITLTAAADSTAVFGGWSGACSGAGACTLTLDTSKNVTATFNRLTYPLSVSLTGTGEGSVGSSLPGIDCGATCSATYDVNTVVTLSATPTSISTFGGWAGACTGSGACTLTMSQARTVTATFTRRNFDVTVAVAGSGAGSVTSSVAGISACTGTCTASFPGGSAISLTASPAGNSNFSGWSGACTGTGLCTLPMTSSASVTATFTKKRFTLALTRTGSGTVTSAPSGVYCGAVCSADFDAGTQVTLTATPDGTAIFAGWGGSCTGSTLSCTVSVDGPRAVTATFTTLNYLVTVQKAGTGGGAVQSTPAGIDCGGSCTSGFDAGTVVTLSATPNAQSLFTGWTGACTGLSACTITVNAVKNVTASFDLNRYALSVSKGGNGTGTVTSGADGQINCGGTCSAMYISGTPVTLSAIPAATSTFAGWTGACGGTGDCTITMNQAQSVMATFTSSTFSLSVSTGTGGGSVYSDPVGIACGAACSSTFANGTVVTLTAVPDATATFVGWGGSCTGSTTTCQVSIDGAKTVNASFTYALTVLKAGAGGGTVSSSPSGIACGLTCSAGFTRTQIVTLSATPDAQSVFAGWTGACTGAGACSVTMDSARSVTATFNRATFSVTISRNGSGGGTVQSGDSPRTLDCGAACTSTYTIGAAVALTATPDASSTFAGWTGACTGTGACSVTVDANKTVAATFLKRSVVLTVARAGTGTGAITSSVGGIYCGSSCSATLDAGSSVTLTATPDPTATFTGWSGGGCSGNGTCTVTLSADTSVTATFANSTYALTVSRVGSGSGSVSSNPSGVDCPATSCTTTYSSGTVVTLTATPDGTSSFGGWNGACVGTGVCTVTMSAARSVSAAFTRQSYALTVVKTGSGTGNISSVDTPKTIDCGATCSATYVGGTTVTLNPTADATALFTGWTGACSGSGACTVTMNAAATVTATFTKRTFALTVTRTGGGAVSSAPAGVYCGVACTASFDAGSVVTLTATPDTGAAFAGWTGGGCGTASTCAVTIDAAKTVAARFTLPLTVSKIGSGGGTLVSTPPVTGIDCTSCTLNLDGDSLLTLTATADATSRFDGWTGACTGTGTCTITMSGPQLVAATFTRVAYALNVSKVGNGAGAVQSGDTPKTIDCGATCAASYTTGTSVTLTATPDSNSTFVGWTGACTSASTTCTLGMTQARNVVATFGKRQITVTVTRTGAGTVTSSTGGIFCGSACAGTVDAGTTVTLTATADATTSFTGWSGGGCSGTGACIVTVTSDTTLSAIFSTVQNTLAVTRSGTGGGTVTANPSGVVCPGTCSAPYPSGTVVTLTAAPDSTSTFAGWSGVCSGAGICTVTMTDNKAVTATFTRQSFPLTVAKIGTGGGSVAETPPNAVGIDCGATCAASYLGGASVSLAATADINSTFSGWSGACTGTGGCTVSIAAATSVTATFVRKSYVLTLTRTGGGAVTSSPAGLYCGAACAASFDAGGAVLLTATPDSGATFVSFTGGGCGTSSTCTVTMDAAKTVSARFTFPLTITKNGTGGGTVDSGTGGPVSCGATCSAPVNGGTLVTLSATPDSTSAFSGWAGACNGTDTTCALTMDNVKNVTATFTRVLYTLGVSKIGSGGGTVQSGDTPKTVDCGTTCTATYTTGTAVTLTATPDSNSTFTGWTGACTTTSNTCTMSMSQARTATATFTRRQVTLTVSRSGTGTITSSLGGIFCGSACLANLDAGTSVTLTATADPTTSFAGWGGACASSGTGTCTITVTGDTTIPATFTINTYGLTVTRVGTGGGSVVSSPLGIDCPTTACAASFSSGTVVTLSAQPDATSSFAGWSGGLCAGTGACTVTMSQARTVTATFTRNTYTLAVGKSGTGDGTIAETPTNAAGINCGATCSAGYTGGTSVTIVATPDANSTFVGWSGACSGAGSCSVVMNQSTSVTATFARRQFSLTVAKTGSGLVASSPSGIYCGVGCSGVFDAGSTVVLTAFADPNATFVGWTGDCASTAGAVCNVTMASARNVTATFTNGLTVVLSGTGTGTVTSSSGGINCGTTCAATYSQGASVVLTATAASDSQFGGWTGACSGTAATCTISMDASKSVTAFFNKATYLLFVNRTGNGTVSSSPTGINCGDTCAASFDAGSTVTLTAQPDTGATFAGWRGACTGTGSCTISMNGVKYLTAAFGYPLTVTTDSGGVVTSSPAGISCGSACSSVFNPGDTVVLTATPLAGRAFAGWSGACSGTSPSCTVAMSAAMSVGASFGYTLAVSSTGNGALTSTPSGINCGTTCVAGFPSNAYVTITGTGSTTEQVTSWTGCDAVAGNTCSVRLSANKSVSATFASIAWREANTGMIGGQVNSLGLDPNNPNVLYAATQQGAVFKTVSAGDRWSAASSGLPNATLGAASLTSVAVAATSSATLYASSAVQGVFRSADSGATWTQIVSGLSNQAVNVVRVDPNNASIAYAGTTTGVYKTTNGGTSWALSSSGLSSSVTELVFNPTTSATLYAAASTGVFRSTDSGATWTSVSTGLTSTNVRDLAVDPTNASVLYAATAGGVFKTSNGGTGWTAASTGLTTTDALSVAVDPTNTQILYAGTNGGGVFRSANAGGAWTAVPGLSNALAGVVIKNVSVNALGVAFAATADRGVFRTSDGGQNWLLASTNLAPVQVSGVAIAATDPTRLYAATMNAGVYRSSDAGSTWASANTGLPAGVGINWVAIDPTNANIVYAATNGSGVYRTSDGGQNWSSLSSGLAGGAGLTIVRLAINPSTTSIVYAATGAGVYKTSNGGASWAAANTGLTVLNSLTNIVIDPVTPANLYIATNGNGLFKSTDSAGTWTAISATIGATSSVFGLAIDPTNPNVLYAGTFAGAIYKTTTAGSTWTAIRTGTGSILGLAVSASNPAQVYAATSGAGVLKTTDSGSTWNAVNGTMPTLSVMCVASDPTSATVYLGTLSTGVFKSNTGGQ